MINPKRDKGIRAWLCFQLVLLVVPAVAKADAPRRHCLIDLDNPGRCHESQMLTTAATVGV